MFIQACSNQKTYFILLLGGIDKTVRPHISNLRPGGIAHRYSSQLRYTDGWVTCDFMSFQTVFQLYRDNGQILMKGFVQWNPIYEQKRSPPHAELEPGIVRSVGQRLTY